MCPKLGELKSSYIVVENGKIMIKVAHLRTHF